ncbi:TPA: hypothetical protein DDW69_03585 [candidate division CPR2 bacterium]|nr:MAG: hypothetical protein A2Y27_03365 [candidate division CPR2 bacterium GWD1_39_7]HBG81897.1 hypothetical protein [candidate division CPR2 bacterium]HCL99931.1 hypothetical protein [candidate division CPR2 bacterium]
MKLGVCFMRIKVLSREHLVWALIVYVGATTQLLAIPWSQGMCPSWLGIWLTVGMLVAIAIGILIIIAQEGNRHKYGGISKRFVINRPSFLAIILFTHTFWPVILIAVIIAYVFRRAWMAELVG